MNIYKKVRKTRVRTTEARATRNRTQSHEHCPILVSRCTNIQKSTTRWEQGVKLRSLRKTFHIQATTTNHQKEQKIMTERRIWMKQMEHTRMGPISKRLSHHAHPLVKPPREF